jgi:2-polyprenyl-6-methoxyphenol hydroxylase-like FAD-dependent oxidoreductase
VTGDGPAAVGGTAVVVGAGMAGLCAARVLAERVDEVVVLDHDTLPDGPEPRAQVPQGRHPHILLSAGARLLAGWFPGIVAELESAGATVVDECRDLLQHVGGGTWRRPLSDLRDPVMSRPLLEWTVRRRVAALPGVTIRDATGVTGLRTDPARTRVTGVVLADGTSQAGDLVVDATGRRARSLAWLADLGYPPPRVTEVGVDMRYVSRLYRRTDRPERDWKAAMVIGDPASRRAAAAVPVEGDRWIVSLAGFNGVRSPTDPAGMLAYAQMLDSPVIAEILEASEPLGEPVSYRFTTNQRRHVERLRRFPLGWVPLGDAVASFDPVYGQGMTVAAQQAAALGASLDRAGSVDRAFARSFFTAAAATLAAPWSIAVGGDFTYPGTTGRKPVGTDLFNRYIDRVFLAAQHEDTVVIRVCEVLGLLRPPTALLAPGLALRVLRSPGRSRPAARVRQSRQAADR